jgi:hypothetical protein
MAEERHVWQDFLAAQQHEITRAFRELHDRWRGIFDQEGARWSQAGQEWQLARGQDGQLSWDGYPKTFEETVKDFQQALHDMREATDMRLPWEAYSGYGSYMSGPPPERQTQDWMPPRGTVAYVEWVVRDAIRTGYEEGYPLRADQIENIRQEVWAQEIGEPNLARSDTFVETLQETLQDIRALLQEVHPQSAEAMDVRHEAAEMPTRLAELRQPTDFPVAMAEASRDEPHVFLVRDPALHDPEYGTQHYGFEGEDLPGEPERAIDIDTSDPDMGASWQQTLQQLQARLDALEQEVSPQDKAQEHTHNAGMGY